MDPSTVLSARAAAAIERARAQPFSYVVRMLASPENRLLVILGEAHLKLRNASRIGAELVDAIELRGVEGFPRKRVLAGEVLKLVIEGPRIVLRVLSGGLIKGSTIVGARRARAGTTFPLEGVSRIPLSLHVASLYVSLWFLVLFTSVGIAIVQPKLPVAVIDGLATSASFLSLHMLALVPAALLQGRSWNWLIHPAIAFLDVRNQTMAEGTLAMFEDNPSSPVALVIVGRGHVRGYERQLRDRYGFTPVEWTHQT